MSLLAVRLLSFWDDVGPQNDLVVLCLSVSRWHEYFSDAWRHTCLTCSWRCHERIVGVSRNRELIVGHLRWKLE